MCKSWGLGKRLDKYNSLPEDLKTYTSCYIISSTINQRRIKHANADKMLLLLEKNRLTKWPVDHN